MIGQATGLTPDLAERRLHQLHDERALDARLRAHGDAFPAHLSACLHGGPDFIDFTRDDNPQEESFNVND